MIKAAEGESITNESVSIKFAILIVVHLDARLVIVDAFGDYAKLGKRLEQFIFGDVLRKR